MKLRTNKNSILFTILITLSGCGQDYCSDLIDSAENEAIRTYLIEWVDQNISGLQDLESKLIYGGGMGPGSHYLKRPNIEWQKLAFKAPGQVRILSEVPFYEDDYLQRIRNVFIGERSGKGFLIRFSVDESFLEDNKYIKKNHGKVAVLCIPRD